MPAVDPDALETFVRRLVDALGAGGETAAVVAEALVNADLAGHHSHGVRLLPGRYAGEIRTGAIDPEALPAVARESGSLAVVDGRRAFGHAVGRFAVETLVETAGDTGVGAVGVRNTTHLGRIGEWTERLAEAGLASVALVCSPASSHVAPPGSPEPRLSTNPVSVGLPTFGARPFPVVLDMATSQVAKGKVRLRRATGDALAEEWVTDEDGRSVTAPDRHLGGEGALLPLGGFTSGYKGFALAAVSELLAASLADGDVSGEADPLDGNEAALLAVDLRRVTAPERVAERVEAFDRHLRETGPGEFDTGAGAGADRPMLPGEPEYRNRQRQLESGVELPDADATALRELAARVGLEAETPSELAGDGV